MESKDFKPVFVVVVALCMICVISRIYGQTFTEHSNFVTQEEAIRAAVNYMQVRDRVTPVVAEVRTEKVGDTVCMYNVSFSDGLWSLVSASKSCVPILAHGYADTGADSISVPEAFLYLIDWYKMQILTLIRSGDNRQDFIDKWNSI